MRDTIERYQVGVFIGKNTDTHRTFGDLTCKTARSLWASLL